MAKKKAKRKSRRVGAASLNPSSPVVKIAALAAGYFLGDTLNEQILKLLPATDIPATATTPATTGPNLTVTKYLPYAELGLGALLLLGKGKPSMIKTLAGGVLAGAGIASAVKDLGIVKGYQSVPVLGNRRRVAGYQDTPVIGATPAVLQGQPGSRGNLPAQLSGYGVNGVPGYQPNGSGLSGVMGSLYTNSGSGLSHYGTSMME